LVVSGVCGWFGLKYYSPELAPKDTETSSFDLLMQGVKSEVGILELVLYNNEIHS